MGDMADQNIADGIAFDALDDGLSAPVTCPTCGSPVTVHTSDEGTGCYVPDTSRLSTYESLGTPEEFEAYKAEHEAARNLGYTPVNDTAAVDRADDAFWAAHDYAERMMGR